MNETSNINKRFNLVAQSCTDASANNCYQQVIRADYICDKDVEKLTHEFSSCELRMFMWVMGFIWVYCI